MRIRVRVARLKAPASARPSIRRAIRKRIGRIRGCYRRLLRKHPQSKGNISVGFIVTKSGRVTSPLLMHSDIAQGAMNRCAVGAVGSMKTGALPDVVDANVVFSLQKR
jgi:outer membrane biosynthesis protein TonB